MSSANLSGKSLSRLRAMLADHVERGNVPGAVALISYHDEVHIETVGTKAVTGNQPMARDTIFRISSMTKPLAAAATMLAVEEGRFQLDDPVDALLPELAGRSVLKQIDGSLEDTVPANRPITVRDLLTMRMGFGFILEPSSTYPLHQAATELGVMPGPPLPMTPLSPDEWLRRFATLPLMYQPGANFTYQTPFSVLSVLLERAAEQPLETLLRERIFGPLGMKDTSFSVPPEKLDRLTSCYTASAQPGALELYDDAKDSAWRTPPRLPDAGGGLVSTVDDYLAFGQMMLDGGTYRGERILKRASVEAMTTNQLTPEQQASGGFFLDGGRGWGLGVSVLTDGDDVAVGAGRFGWDGGLGTSWYSDPSEGLVGILMTQVLGFPSRIDSDFWTSVYQAIDD